MLYLDLAILNLTEWACRRFQQLTGRTNVWLAVQLTNLSIIVYFVWAVAAFWNGGIGTRLFVGLFCSVVLYALTQTVFKVPIELLEGNAYRRVAKGLRNPRRVRDALLRVSFLTLSLLLCYPVLFVYVSLHISVLLLSYSLIALTTGVLYLLACDPLPPCMGKIREWVGRLTWQSAAAEGARQFESEPAKGFALDIQRIPWLHPTTHKTRGGGPGLVASVFSARSAGLGPPCEPLRGQNSVRAA